MACAGMSLTMSKGTKVLSVTKDDCTWEYMPAGKNGGQKGNKTASAVRVKHPPSGAVGESREERSQLQNRKIAFRRMVESPKFKIWLNRVLASGPTPEERVEKDMQPENLLVETRVNGTWQAD